MRFKVKVPRGDVLTLRIATNEFGARVGHSEASDS